MERRRTPRFRLTEPMDAHLSVLQDVQIEQAAANKVSVISSRPAIRGEKMLLRIGAADQVQVTMTVRVDHCEPWRPNRRMTFRIRLTAEGSIGLGDGVDGNVGTWTVGSRAGALLMREYPARIANVSRGGCLIEAAARLPEGTVARIHQERGSFHADPVRVVFLQERRGTAWAYAKGVEFLSLSAPSSYSLRAIAQQMDEGSEHAFGALLTEGYRPG